MKHLFTFFALICSYMLCGAQATTLVVDNQTPGWLSSKINYGDQLTVKNLTVIGYLNANDLEFIGTLVMNHELSGLIDLDDCHIISSKGKETNALDENMFNLSWNSERPNGYTIRHLKLPRLLQVSNKCLNYKGLLVDTLTVGGTSMPLIQQNFLRGQTGMGNVYSYNSGVKNIIFREGVEEISDRCFLVITNTQGGGGENYEDLYNSSWREASQLESIHFPSTLKTIGKEAFLRCLNLKTINLPNGIESIGDKAFCCTSFQPDTLKLPQSLKNYYVTSFYVKDQQVIIVPNVEGIGFGSSYSYKGAYVDRKTSLTFFMNSPLRPKVLTKPYEDCLKSCTFYVPSGSYDSYMQPDINQSSGYNYNPFCFAKIIEMTSIEKIMITPKAASLKISQTVSLFADITPNNAFNRLVKWDSSNESVATVDSSGKVTALNGGEVIITAASVENPEIKDECIVTVIQPVNGITLNKTSLDLAEGESEQLVATIAPDDASNKTVNWISSDISVAMISPNGTVYALKPGQATIMATTVDGGFVAICKIVVSEYSGIDDVVVDSNEKVKIYNLQGILIYDGEYSKANLSSGVYIVVSQGAITKRIIQ